MQTISEFMAADHSRCDQLYADGESALLAEKFEVGWEYISAFDLAIRRAFRYGRRNFVSSMFPGVAASIIYAVTVWQMLQQKKHKIVDATLRFW